MRPRIRTTVVGSYPVPEWLVAAPSEQALIDATRVVIATQEAAGVDVVCDGELYRFDVNHPETNGMIEYFVRPMQGVRYEMSFDEVMAYRSQPGMRFRTRPPGVVDGPIASGTLDLPLACQRAAALATKTFKFTVTGPHMLAKTLLDRHYGDTPELAHALADVLAEQVGARRGRHRPDRRGQPARPPRGMGMGGLGDQPRARRGAHEAGGAPVLRQLRRPERAARHLGSPAQLPQCPSRRSRRARVRAPAAGRARRLQGPEARDRLRPRRGRHQGDRGRVGRGGRARDRARRADSSAPAACATSIPTAASGC